MLLQHGSGNTRHENLYWLLCADAVSRPQVVAYELGVPLNQVFMLKDDTFAHANGQATGGSATSDVTTLGEEG